jgi:hypothetical protein
VRDLVVDRSRGEIHPRCDLLGRPTFLNQLEDFRLSRREADRLVPWGAQRRQEGSESRMVSLGRVVKVSTGADLGTYPRKPKIGVAAQAAPGPADPRRPQITCRGSLGTFPG